MGGWPLRLLVSLAAFGALFWLSGDSVTVRREAQASQAPATETIALAPDLPGQRPGGRASKPRADAAFANSANGG